MTPTGALCVFLALAGTALPSQAATINMTFDDPVALSATQAPGTWYTDRYAPTGFDSQVNFLGDNRLALELSAADGANNRPAAFSSDFYNTQGRKYDTDPGTAYVSVDMYIDSDFQSDPGRVAGLWATAVNDANAVTAYPIIEFNNGTFRGWESTGNWFEMGLPPGFLFDEFATLSILLDVVANQIEYSVNGYLLQTVSALGATSLSNIILQGHNTTAGIDRTIYFDNLTAAPVPLPAALPLLGAVVLGGAGLARFSRRRSKHQAELPKAA